MSPPVGPDPVHVKCPACHADILTRVESRATTRTHTMALKLCLLCCCLCACLPYCMKSCQNLNHYCPHCKCFLGTYSN